MQNIEPQNYLGRTLIILGIIIFVIGIFLVFKPKIPYLGKLPGDINITKPNFRFYFPITSSIIISIIISLILYLFTRSK